MNASYQNREEEILLNRLKDIILREDRAALKQLKAEFNDDDLFAERVSPIVQQHLDFLKNNFKKEYKSIINEIVEQKLKSSQEEIINTIYPAMGTMVKKFIVNEFQKLKEGIESKIKSSFSSKSAMGRFRAFFSRKKESEIILSSMDQTVIQEIYIIQRDSGVLIANASREKTIDQDVIAGMLTAIKSFVEDAFRQSNEELQMIEYGTYKIFIQSFHTYYIAVAISGSLSARERDQLSADLFNFAEEELSGEVHKLNGLFSEEISAHLNVHFFEKEYNSKTNFK